MIIIATSTPTTPYNLVRQITRVVVVVVGVVINAIQVQNRAQEIKFTQPSTVTL